VAKADEKCEPVVVRVPQIKTAVLMSGTLILLAILYSKLVNLVDSETHCSIYFLENRKRKARTDHDTSRLVEVPYEQTTDRQSTRRAKYFITTLSSTSQPRLAEPKYSYHYSPVNPCFCCHGSTTTCECSEVSGHCCGLWGYKTIQ